MSRVGLGMSGGVDSSVAVHLLQQAGHEVVGLHMHLVQKSARDSHSTDDARIVAEQFGIEFHVIEAQDAFARNVVEPFAQAYLTGRTPNPCVRCNAHIKFGLLWQVAKQLGCEMLATGHYARIIHNADKNILATAADPLKDQSYFLWGIPRDMLAHILFPLGEYSKSEIRQIGISLGLITAEKKESQEICFIPNDDYAAFLQSYCPENLPGKGSFLDASGKIIGSHQGAWHYTIGQRRGLGLALGYAAYVTAIDAANNTVKVGTNDALFANTLIADEVNLLQPHKTSGQGLIKIRSRDRGTFGNWYLDGSHLLVHFATPVRAITPGQSVVIYEDGRVICGGIIQQAVSTERTCL